MPNDLKIDFNTKRFDILAYIIFLFFPIINSMIVDVPFSIIDIMFISIFFPIINFIIVYFYKVLTFCLYNKDHKTEFIVEIERFGFNIKAINDTAYISKSRLILNVILRIIYMAVINYLLVILSFQLSLISKIAIYFSLLYFYVIYFSYDIRVFIYLILNNEQETFYDSLGLIFKDNQDKK